MNTKTTTTVQALLSVLVGRDPNEVIIIENNELRIVSTINLLSNDPQPMGQMFQVMQAAVRPLVPTTKPTEEVPAPEVAVVEVATVDKIKRATPNVINGNRAWCPDELKVMAALRAKGVSFYDIAKAFGRTSRAIECQLHYLRHPEARPAPKPRVVPSSLVLV